MPLAFPKIAVLDTATLNKISRDYWSPNQALKDKARSFLAELTNRGVYVAFTSTHVIELLRHNDERVVRDRLKFLRGIPLIAWLRPYNRIWFPGDIPDLHRRELHAVRYDSAKGWSDIIEHVRSELWETGVGSEMFVDNEQLWSTMREETKRHHDHEMYVASVSRTDAGNIYDQKFGDLLTSKQRTKAERIIRAKQFALEMQRQLDGHGDKRLTKTQKIAIDFARDTLTTVADIESRGDDMIRGILEFYKIPIELVTPEMTIGDIGELGVKQLSILSKSLRPSTDLTIRDVPLTTLPSHVLDRELRLIQQKAARVSGSDLGDRHLAALILYCEGTEVDKRTFEFLTQLRRSNTELAKIMGLFFRSSDYSTIPKRFGE